jgi:hypothetical protein
MRIRLSSRLSLIVPRADARYKTQTPMIAPGRLHFIVAITARVAVWILDTSISDRLITAPPAAAARVAGTSIARTATSRRRPEYLQAGGDGFLLGFSLWSLCKRRGVEIAQPLLTITETSMAIHRARVVDRGVEIRLEVPPPSPQMLTATPCFLCASECERARSALRTDR